MIFLDLKLHRLTGLEQDKIVKEFEENDLEELKIWTVEAKVRLNQTHSLSLMNLEKLILYLEGQNAVIKGDYLITITKLYQLFPSIQFFKLFLP